ncbi:MAG: SAM-dependent methyltransferase [Deltaproteobacteria bacterium]|nr:SAM-dependent methyltransferase [Deltaproteobacteria bacterium]
MPNPPRFMVSAALSLYRNTHALADRMVPAQLAVLDRMFGVVRTATIGTAARLRLADHLADGPLDAAALAARAGLDVDATHRLMRTLASLGVFTLHGDGRFSNNRLSHLLRSEVAGSLRNFADYMGSASNLRAYSDLDGAVRTGVNAFETVNGHNVWDWFAAHPDEGKTFAGAMRDGTSMDARVLAAGFGFGDAGKVCDVAGGQGTLLAEILVQHPGLGGVLFDEAHVLAEADPLLRARGVLERTEKVAGSFFESIPGGCGAYVLKDILHDWDDARSMKILANVRRAAAPGAHVVLIETLVEANEAVHPGPMIDLHMLMVCLGGRQRSRADFERLLAATGFRLERVAEVASIQSLVIGVAV